MKNQIINVVVIRILFLVTILIVSSTTTGIASASSEATLTQIELLGNWTEIQKILASDSATLDRFGDSVSLDGDTTLIGAYWDDDNGPNSGSAYVFTHTNNSWTFEAKLRASDGHAYDLFGSSVFISGNIALIGALHSNGGEIDSGAVYIFTRTGTSWIQQQKLLPSDAEDAEFFGCALTLSGDTALIGAQYDNDHGRWSGSAYVFFWTGTTWIQQQKLLASDEVEGQLFGSAVSLSGDTALIGAPNDFDNGYHAGSAYIFSRTGALWTQQAKLLASDGEEDDRFGITVSLESDTALIGANYDDDKGIDSGSAYVFRRTDNTWIQQQKLLASDGEENDRFGNSVSLDRNIALIGAPLDNDRSGSAYVFICTGTTWIQQAKLFEKNGSTFDEFGWSVSLDETTIIIGTPGYENFSGSAYVFMGDFENPNLDIRITGGLGIHVKITNKGIVDANNIAWQIHVEGGILQRINETRYGTIDILAGNTKSVGGLFFGFGPIMITAKAVDEEITTSVFLFLFIILRLNFLP